MYLESKESLNCGDECIQHSMCIHLEVGVFRVAETAREQGRSTHLFRLKDGALRRVVLLQPFGEHPFDPFITQVGVFRIPAEPQASAVVVLQRDYTHSPRQGNVASWTTGIMIS